MKICHMMIGCLIEADDSVSAEILMNYAMNTLNLKNETGVLRSVEVRELRIPAIIDKETGDETAKVFHTGQVN